MRKRSGRQPRYAAIPNETIDDAPRLDFMALGLLNVLLRHRDGWDVTLADIGTKYGYGRDAMAGAMGLLQVARYVIKVRLMSVEGNQWSTEVCVYDTPATDAEVAALLAEAEAEPGVKRAQVIEPTATAIAAARKRLAKLQPKRKQAPSVAVPRVPENPHSGATCENDEKPQVGPECRDSRQSGNPAVFKKTVVQKEREKTEAVSPRSGGDVRSTSTSGSTREAEGGCAASSKTSPSSTQHDDTDRPARGQKSGSNKAKHTREQLTLVASVRAHFPAEFLGDLPDVPTLSQAILDALAGDVPASDRTVEQLGARIQQRWNHHGWASKYYAGDIDSLVGAAVAMVRPLKAGDRYGCANPRCEAGVDVDTKQDCQTCPARLAARTAQRRAPAVESPDGGAASELPVQRVHRPFVDCSCGDPIAKDSDDTMCRKCRRDADDAEETARLRAQFAAQYGTPEQVDAYCNNAPF